jgi:predicted small secreted protein
MKHRPLIPLLLCSLLVTACATPTGGGKPVDVIPSELIGVWATDGAVMRGPYLIEGSAVYLGSDGSGALVGGPPPIGVALACQFDAPAGALECDMHDGYSKQRYGQFRLRYDRSTQTLERTAAEKAPFMSRRFDKLTDDVRRGLGMPP